MTSFGTRFSSMTIVAVMVVVFSGGIAFAGKSTPTTSVPTGNDVSWPQCGKTLPQGQAFGIVGVNNGLANNDNPCLADQLAWAANTTGSTGQEKVALYVNTANPGLTGSWWPKSNVYAGITVTSVYGTCTGGDDAACAYVYGYAKAYDDAVIRHVPNPSSYRWWLDVETINSWETNKVANAAVLEGMTAYFQSSGARVGLYSTTYQWGKLIGTVSPTSNLNGLESWLPGSRSLSGAISACSGAQLTANSPVTLTQYISQNLDYNYSCKPIPAPVPA